MNRNIKEAQWIWPIQSGFHLACCDCGLVHRLDFKVVNGEVQFRVHRAVKQTKLRRQSVKLSEQEILNIKKKFGIDPYSLKKREANKRICPRCKRVISMSPGCHGDICPARPRPSFRR
jgi:hypothetical protein